MFYSTSSVTEELQNALEEQMTHAELYFKRAF